MGMDLGQAEVRFTRVEEEAKAEEEVIEVTVNPAEILHFISPEERQKYINITAHAIPFAKTREQQQTLAMIQQQVSQTNMIAFGVSDMLDDIGSKYGWA